MELDVRFKGKINVVKKAPYIRMELADPQAKELPLVANGAFGFIGLQVLIICTLAVPRDALIIKFQNLPDGARRLTILKICICQPTLLDSQSFPKECSTKVHGLSPV